MANHKAIFLDRDDTLIVDPGYINNPDQVTLLEGAAEALIAFKQLGYKLILITNQSAVARGIITEQQLRVIHDRLEYLLAQQGAHLDQIYYCPHHPEGTVDKYRQTSDMRKPNPGMLLAAAKQMHLDLEQSWCLGDRISDIEAGARAGCRTIMISAHSPVSHAEPGQVQPDHIAVNLREAVNIVKQQKRTKHQHYTNETATTTSIDESVEKKTSTPTSAKPTSVSKPSVSSAAPSIVPTPPAAGDNQDTELLQAILEQLRGQQRQDMFDEFSMIRMIAGIAQMAVVLCLLIAVWLLMGSDRQLQAVLATLGFGTILQMMALTLYIMRTRQ